MEKNGKLNVRKYWLGLRQKNLNDNTIVDLIGITAHSPGVVDTVGRWFHSLFV